MIGKTNSGGADKSKGLTATAADIKSGKTALVNGNVITGAFKSLFVEWRSMTLQGEVWK